MNSRRVHNFSAGPATLPFDVLTQAQEELLNWNGTGMSVMEMSHRSDEFLSIANQARDDLRELLNVPDHYHILFLQGGATTEFSMIPMNFLARANKADYAQTGVWSQKAIEEAQRYGDIHIAVETREVDGKVTIPSQDTWSNRADATYFHYTPNETINGVWFPFIPKVEGTPLVADMSSSILSREIDVSQFGLIYAGAQKNIGPAGITIVIIRDDMLQAPMAETPSMLDYQKQVEAESMLNTPPTFSWYMVGLVLQWLKRQGGIAEIEKHNRAKADKLYAYIDQEPFYSNPVAAEFRSMMNVPFTLARDSLDKTFLSEADKAGLANLKGHRSVGGMRASIYNAMTMEGIDKLIDFMQDFAANNV